MKIGRKIFAIILTMIAFVAFTFPFTVKAEEEAKKVDLLFVHDVHSHLNTFSTVEDGKTVKMGGLSRIKTLANEQFAKNADTLFVDAGDFSMGTLVQSIFETESAELRVLGALGIEATTIGNHEFDYGPNGLKNSLLRAIESGDVLPAMLISNLDWEMTRQVEFSKESLALLDTLETYGVKDYIMVKKGDVNIAIMGIYGMNALECSPFCELVFKDPVVAAKETVAKIQANEDADMIVCLSHSGTWKDETKSEDEILEKNVPEIDVIISGHTHTKLSEPIVHGTTYIASAGEYGKYLGSMSLTQKEDGSWDLNNYELLPITMDVPQDAEMQKKIDDYVSLIDVNYLYRYGYTRDQVLAENEVDFVDSSTLASKHVERNLGSIMADAYRYTVESLPEWDGTPVDVAVVPAGLVRETYPIGNITVEDVFNSFSLGIGEDGFAGYPLISFYLTGKELKIVAEIDASISPLMSSARLYTSGLQWTFNPNRMILSKSFDAHLVTLNGERIELEDDKLYHLVADLYSARLIGSVTDLSFGLLSIVPKYADGTVMDGFQNAIIKTEGRELKAWEAMARYMESFEDTDGDGIPNISTRYAKEEGRKVVEDSKNIIDLLKSPNQFFFMIIGIILVVLLLLILIIVLFVKLIRKVTRRKRV